MEEEDSGVEPGRKPGIVHPNVRFPSCCLDEAQRPFRDAVGKVGEGLASVDVVLFESVAEDDEGEDVGVGVQR